MAFLIYNIVSVSCCYTSTGEAHASRQVTWNHYVWLGHCLTIDLTEHNIHGSDHGDNVGNKVALGHEIQSSQVGETRRTDLAAVRTVASIRDKVDTYETFAKVSMPLHIQNRPFITVFDWIL